jgi:hypothetical protein
MHYGKGCHCTQGLLLTDYLKDLLAHGAKGFGDAFTVQAPVPAPTTAAVSSPDYGMSAFLWGIRTRPGAT